MRASHFGKGACDVLAELSDGLRNVVRGVSAASGRRIAVLWLASERDQAIVLSRQRAVGGVSRFSVIDLMQMI